MDFCMKTGFFRGFLRFSQDFEAPGADFGIRLDFEQDFGHNPQTHRFCTPLLKGRKGGRGGYKTYGSTLMDCDFSILAGDS